MPGEVTITYGLQLRYWTLVQRVPMVISLSVRASRDTARTMGIGSAMSRDVSRLDVAGVLAGRSLIAIAQFFEHVFKPLRLPM